MPSVDIGLRDTIVKCYGVFMKDGRTTRRVRRIGFRWMIKTLKRETHCAIQNGILPH